MKLGRINTVCYIGLHLIIKILEKFLCFDEIFGNYQTFFDQFPDIFDTFLNIFYTLI